MLDMLLALAAAAAVVLPQPAFWVLVADVHRRHEDSEPCLVCGCGADEDCMPYCPGEWPH
jgi:hypothetical protein